MAFISIKALWKRRHDRRRQDRLVDNSANRLPLEIIEIIIYFLHDDPRGLSICSLVCKAWLAVCRDHRFFKIALDHENFKGFLGLLRSSQFSAHIHSRTLGISMVQSHERWFRFYIPHMRRFSVTHLLIDSKSYLDLPPLVTSFQSVTNLELIRPLFRTIVQFVDVICGLNNLERLSLFAVRFNALPYPLRALSYEEQQFPQKLQELRLVNLHSNDGMALYHWLKGCKPALAPIHTFSLHVTIESSYAKEFFWTSAGEILSNFSSLKYLTISSFGLATTDVLSHNDALLSLHLPNIDLREVACTIPPWDPHLSWNWVPELLSQVVSPCIQVVVFEITIDDVHELESLDWERVAQSLSRPQFSQLRRVLLMMSKLGTKVEKRIREKLPECWERGIVQVCQLHRSFGLMGGDFYYLDSRTRTHNSADPLEPAQARMLSGASMRPLTRKPF